MKVKSYRFLFRIFSYLSDKTNGAPLFVKYKLLLGTIIIGLTGVTGESCKRVKTSYVPISEPVDTTQILCYEPVAPSPEDNLQITCYDTIVPPQVIDTISKEAKSE